MAGGAVSVQKPYACHEGGFGWVGSCGKGSVSQKGSHKISEPPGPKLVHWKETEFYRNFR